MTKTFKPIPRFNDHGPSCKGHANYMLDCTYENENDRVLMISILDRQIARLDKEIEEEHAASITKNEANA